MKRGNFYDISGISTDASQEKIENALHETLRTKQRRMIGVFVVLFIAILSFTGCNLITDKETSVQSKSEQVQLEDDASKSKDLIEEIKRYASQGRVYGVPFEIGTSVEEVKTAWGEPELGDLGEGKLNYYPGKYISLIVCQQEVCDIKVSRMWNEPDGSMGQSLPPRYESLTFDQVKQVLGNNYIIEDGQFYIYEISDYELTFEVIDGELIGFSVRRSSFPQTIPPPLSAKQREFLSEVWQLGLQGKVYGIPFAIGTPRSEIEKEWGGASYTTENKYLQYDGKASFWLDDDQKVTQIMSDIDENLESVYIVDEDLRRITPEQVIEAWGQAKRERENTFYMLSYFNGTNTITLYFNSTVDEKLNIISVRIGNHL